MSEGLRYIPASVQEATCKPASTACTESSQRLATSATLEELESHDHAAWDPERRVPLRAGLAGTVPAWKLEDEGIEGRAPRERRQTNGQREKKSGEEGRGGKKCLQNYCCWLVHSCVYNVSLFTGNYIIPLVVICVLFCVMLCRRTSLSSTPATTTTTQSAAENSERCDTPLVVVVVVVFAIFWLPLQVIIHSSWNRPHQWRHLECWSIGNTASSVALSTFGHFSSNFLFTLLWPRDNIVCGLEYIFILREYCRFHLITSVFCFYLLRLLHDL